MDFTAPGRSPREACKTFAAPPAAIHAAGSSMPAFARRKSFSFHRVVPPLLIVLGAVASVIVYHAARRDEAAHAELEFARRASVRHTLTREILDRYEDSLFGLSALFMLDGNVTRTEFARATSRLEERIS